MEISALIRDISLIIASITAIYGIWSWRKEYIGKKKIELVEEILSLFHEAKDNISYMRCPLGFAGEGTPNLNELDNSQAKWAREQANVLFNRYKEKEKSFNRLFSLKYRFIVNFGKDSEAPFIELNKVLNKLSFAATNLAHYWVRLEHSSEQQRDRIIEIIEKNENIFWERPDEKDEIKDWIETIITEIEAICKPIIKSLSK